MPKGNRLLILEAAACLVAARCGLKLIGFRRLIATLGREESATHDAEAIRRVAAAVNRAANALRCSCLPRAFAAAWMLRARGMRPTMHYGVRRLDGELAAHAWLEVGPVPVIGHEQAERFAVLASFPGGRAVGRLRRDRCGE